MESRRLSCSFIARAASSMSLNIFGLTAAVCAMTALASGSTFNTALQQGHVTSNAGVCAMKQIISQNAWLLGMELDREDFEQGQHLPAEVENGSRNHQYGKNFPETVAVGSGIEA